ncbi:MAG: hypothetical protein KJ886_05835 [Candidatus Thermoplasmatota archaeon]|nr:hypothetical protein [Candidatus Thermoplasmatota archaeon]
MNMFNEPTPENIHEYLKKFGLKIRYKPHSLLKEYNAYFMVKILGRKIDTNAGKKLSIPENEIWISEKFKDFEKYILFHELVEIYYRFIGYDWKKAHEMAVEKEIKYFSNDPKWRKMNKVMGIGREHLPM